MREILFRGYDEENQRWRYGHFTELQDGARVFNAIIGRDEEGDLTYWYIHDEKSIGQWTGQLDANGIKIFEGDIMKPVPLGYEGEEDLGPCGVIVFKTTNYSHVEGFQREPFRGDDDYYGTGPTDLDCQGRDVLVCGNNFENPELLVTEVKV